MRAKVPDRLGRAAVAAAGVRVLGGVVSGWRGRLFVFGRSIGLLEEGNRLRETFLHDQGVPSGSWGSRFA